MLTEYFPAWVYDKELNNPNWFEENRLRIPPLLDLWDNAALVVPLRQALVASLAVKQTWSASIGPFLGASLRFYQDALIRSLGRRGAFGVLAGLALPAELNDAFVVHMVIGYCRIEEDGRFLNHVWERDAQVYEAMARVMEQQFGLSEQEQHACLEQYTRYMSALDDHAGF